ncbi:MAG: multidrug effflux MFS transporter [Burkholderiaceae bacterium]|nr:multidrug effflux MFS transporter [Burkholderiaceae bacterium]
MPSDSRTPMTPGVVVLMLSLFLGIQPIATDLYLPALPALTSGFGASMHQAQLTLTGLLLAFGLSQLIWGPLSDRFGRRPILLWGVAAFTLASVGSVFASSMEQLLIWRSVQGAAMGAAVMCARAIVRDLYSPTEGARMMSKGLTGLGLLACISAPLGGLLSDWLGWRAALGALAVFGAIVLTITVLRFEETLAKANPQALHPMALARTWVIILRHPTFWTFTLLAATSYGGLFTFLATSSFVFINALGLSKTQYGLLMFSMSLVYICGTIICRRLIPRFGIRRTVALAGAFTLTGGTLAGVLGWLGWHSVWAIMLPYYLFILAHGVHQPCGQSGAVSAFPQAAGTASALSGFLMMVAAFAMGHWLGMSMPVDVESATVLPLTNGLWFWATLIAAVAWLLVPRFGELRQPPKRNETSGTA